MHQFAVEVWKDLKVQFPSFGLQKVKVANIMMSSKKTGHLSDVKDELTCQLCEGNQITTTVHEHTFQYGTGEGSVDLTVNAPVRYCAACDFAYLDEMSHQFENDQVLTPNFISVSTSVFKH